MNKLLLVLLLISSAVFAQVFEEGAINNAGQPFIRFSNHTNNYVSCYYKDQVNYFTFSIAPRNISQWYPSYGEYIWECR